MLTALAAEQPALLEWHLARHPKRALALCIAQIGRDPDDSFDGVAVRPGAGNQAVLRAWSQAARSRSELLAALFGLHRAPGMLL